MLSIKVYIDRWLGARSNRTLSSLSRTTEVPLSTIRRLYSEEGGLPDSRSTLPVLSAVCTVDEMSAYVSENYPEVTKFYQVLGQNSERHSSYEVLDNSIFRTREGYVAFALAYSGLATEDRLRSMFGSYGVQAAEDLVASGILAKRFDEYLPIDGKEFAYLNKHDSSVLALQHITSMVKSQSKDDSIISMLFSTDDKGREEIEAMTKKFYEDLVAICKRDVPGKHAVALGLAYSRIVDDTSALKKEDPS